MNCPPESSDLEATLESHLRTAREHVTGIRETSGAHDQSKE
jgi:hypothetical protein